LARCLGLTPMIRHLLVCTWACAGLLSATAATAWAGPKVAIFPFELLDVSLTGQYIGPQAEETDRLALATAELRKLAARDAGYEVLDLSGLADDIARAAPLHQCGGCEIGLARKVGAEMAIMGTVRKVSNLVLEAHLFVIDVASGKLAKQHRIELRGNYDETWLRAVRRLVALHVAG
jgi:uncharacterized protein DUF2380